MAASAVLIAPAGAEGPPAATTAAAPDMTGSIDTKQLQLRGLQTSIEASEARRKALSDEIAMLRTDRARFQANLIETTRKAGEEETKTAAIEQRLEALASKEDAVKASLQKHRAVVAEVLAALQRMGRRPPPALLVEPDDVLKAIRTSMLLGTLLPGMRAETEALMADLGDLAHTKAAIEAERRALDTETIALKTEHDRLATLIDARQAALGTAQGKIEVEQETARKLADQAGSLRELISGMERGSAAAAQAADAARKSDEKLAMIVPDGTVPATPAPAKDLARLAPAIAFASMKGQLSRPLSGQMLRRFGEDDGLGSAEKGELISTRVSATVAAPADGWVAFAGPYRSFGKLLILNAGGGYYIVLAGMERINVDLGQFVVAGEPVAVMGDGTTKTAAAIALGAAQPLLYVEFRKDGATIDPSPWWARPELQRVRG